MKILVIGYYNHNNLGDDSYQHIMPIFFPHHDLEFVDADRLVHINAQDYDGIIVGGGDIINDYFNSTIRPFLQKFTGPKIAFSIGIPFPSLITKEYLDHFDHVFTRNFEDLRAIQKIMGAHRAHFIPDISLKYTPSFPRPSTPTKKCGVFLVGNIIQFPFVVEDLSRLISKLALTYEVIFYAFNPQEDGPVAMKVHDLALQRLNEIKTKDKAEKATIAAAKSRITVNNATYSAQEMIDRMVTLDFAVCMRYHSHLFCTIAGTPFLSISSTRKTRSFMQQADLTEYQYEITLDGHGTPIKSEYETMKSKCALAIRDSNTIITHLGVFLQQYRTLLSTLQPNQLLSVDFIPVPDKIAHFIQETEDHHNAARLLSHHMVGYADSPYVWGMYDKFKNAGENIVQTIKDSANYLQESAAKFTHSLLHHDLPLYVDLREYQSYKDAHRGGWYLACEELAKLSSDNGIICDMYLDRTFHWTYSYMKYQGIIPYTSPWCGFIHHTPDTTYSNYNTTALFQIPEFIQSLSTCRALFVLSETLAQFIRSKLESLAHHLPVITFAHPIDTPTQNFNFSSFKKNPVPQLINIGAWMRNPLSIYLIPSFKMQKTILLGKDMNDYLPPDHFSIAAAPLINPDKKSVAITEISVPCRPEPGTVPRWVAHLIQWLQSIGTTVVAYNSNTVYIADSTQVAILNQQIQTMIDSVKVLTYQSNTEYDALLAQNIVFLDLIDAAAVNTIIECIVRQTPIVINKIPGTVTLLGESYPLFYQDVNTIPQILTLDRIKQASQYLKRLDTKRYQLSYFINQMTKVATKLDTL